MPARDGRQTQAAFGADNDPAESVASASDGIAVSGILDANQSADGIREGAQIKDAGVSLLGARFCDDREKSVAQVALIAAHAR